MFHPKVYLFWSDDQYAAFIGSSNLTCGGFVRNVEVNTLVEGSFDKKSDADIRELQNALNRWHSPAHSFEPTTEWLAAYKEQFDAVSSKAQSVELDTPPNHEVAASSTNWLGTDRWQSYYRRVLEGLRQSGRAAGDYHDVLERAAEELSSPWSTRYFTALEKRRIMLGISPYGWLGHVGASGKFRQLLANGSAKQHQVISEVVNAVASLESPIPWTELESELDRLMSLGFKMNVWSRFLAIVRPDLYCTVAAYTVRHNLSEALDVSPNELFQPDGYIRLLRVLHSSPWFLSVEPASEDERAIWRRRVAFMDAIFY
ncbi:MAG: hypothetical protein ACYTGL_26525 [Planctomycetota bacterium]